MREQQGVLLPPDATVFRLWAAPVLPGETDLAVNEMAFRPTPDDVADALARKHLIRLSVWNREKTTVAEAIGFRNTDKKQDAWALRSTDVAEIASAFDEQRCAFQIGPLQLVEDPMPELLSGPGAEGHSGLEGLGTHDKGAKKKAKDFFKMLRSALANKAQRFVDEPMAEIRATATLTAQLKES